MVSVALTRLGEIAHGVPSEHSPATIQTQTTTTTTSMGVELHGAANWHELGYKGKISGGDRIKVGIIDEGFFKFAYLGQQ